MLKLAEKNLQENDAAEDGQQQGRDRVLCLRLEEVEQRLAASSPGCSIDVVIAADCYPRAMRAPSTCQQLLSQSSTAECLLCQSYAERRGGFTLFDGAAAASVLRPLQDERPLRTVRRSQR